MERPLKEIKLPDSGHVASIATYLLYGESRQINGVLLKHADYKAGQVQADFPGEVAMEFAMVKLLCLVKKIVTKDGVVLDICKETFESLTLADAQLLEVECEKVIGDGKKK